MPTESIHKLYQFDKLSDRAKEQARDWYREIALDYDWWEATYEDAATCADILGINLRLKEVKLMNGSTRYDPCIWFSGFNSQGDGACFEGVYDYAKGAAKKIREHAPRDTTLHAIADQLQTVQRKIFYRLAAHVEHYGPDYHENCTRIEVEIRNSEGEWDPAPAPVSDTICETLRSFMRWIYNQLETEHNYLGSDEVVDEHIRINEYTFDENGNRDD